MTKNQVMFFGLIWTLVSCQPSSKVEAAKVNLVPDSVQTPTIEANSPNYSLPENINIIPPDSTNRGVSAISSDSDMLKDKRSLKVLESGTDKFEIVNTILKALKQTRYDSNLVLGKGPYASLILFEDDQVKLEKWIVDSSIIELNHKKINQVKVWIREEERKTIFVKINIEKGATENSPYGIWDLTAEFRGDNGIDEGFFIAQAEETSNGKSIIKINYKMYDDVGALHDEAKGKLVLSNLEGNGIIKYTEREYSGDSDLLKSSQTQYSYNSEKLKLKKDDVSNCKSRNDFVDVNVDYELYDEDGVSIKKKKKFGFPLSSNGRYYYYGQWDGRHYLHGQKSDETLASNQTFKRMDHVNGTYQLAYQTNGLLIKKDLEDISNSSLENKKFESWTFEWFYLSYKKETNTFHRCIGEWGAWDCSVIAEDASDVSKFVDNKAERKWYQVTLMDGSVINWDEETRSYLNTDGFEDGDVINVNSNFPIYLTYEQNKFYKLSPTFILEGEYSRPIFNNDLKEEFSFKHGWGEYYLREVEGQDTFKIFFPQGEEGFFYTQVEKEQIKYPHLIDSPLYLSQYNNNTDTSYVYDHESKTLKDESLHDLNQSLWNLSAEDGNYVYEYHEGRPYSFLKNDEGEIVLLDEAIYLKPFKLNDRIISGLRFDGHLSGIPSPRDIIKNGTDVNFDDLKVLVNVPDGQYISTAGDEEEKSYFLKNTRAVRLLRKLDIESCKDVVMTDLEINDNEFLLFSAPNIGEIPTEAKLLVSEGQFL